MKKKLTKLKTHLTFSKKKQICWWVKTKAWFFGGQGGETKSSQCHSKDLMVTTKLSSIKINKIALSKNHDTKVQTFNCVKTIWKKWRYLSWVLGVKT